MNDDKNLEEKKQSIDSLNERLYHKDEEFGQRKRRKIHGQEVELDHDFDDNYDEILKEQKTRKLPTSFFKKVFLIALFFFLATALVAGISLYEKKQKISDDSISMEILGQPFIDGGEPLELQVRIQNFNEQEIELPDLILSYPKDSSAKEDEVFIRRSLKNIGNGQRVNEEFDIVLYGKEGDVRNIHATLEYRIVGSSSIFVKEVDFSTVIRSTPTDVSVRGPKEIVQGQELKIEFDVSSNTDMQVNDILLKVNYPLGFEVISTSVKPEFGTNIWYFQNITDETQTISITGRLSALPGQGQSFHAEIGKQNPLQKNSIETVFNNITHTIDVQQSFITADLNVNNNGSDNGTIRGGEEVDVEINFKNTTNKTLGDMQIIAHLDGSLYKPEALRVQSGEFDSNTKRITWNKNSMEKLAFIEPGESGTLSFTMQTNQLVGQSGALVNPNLTVIIDVSAIEINGTVREAFAISRAEIIANSDLILLAKTLHNDGPFKNDGPIPPRVGERTKYTVTFQVTNSSNNVENAKVSTFLPPYVNWLGSIAPSIERQKLSYNNTTREVVWDLGVLKPEIGIGTANPKQVSFQIDALPSLSHAGTHLDITKEITLSGKDSFTGVTLSYKKTALSTNLNQEPSAASGAGLVSK